MKTPRLPHSPLIPLLAPVAATVIALALFLFQGQEPTQAQESTTTAPPTEASSVSAQGSLNVIGVVPLHRDDAKEFIAVFFDGELALPERPAPKDIFTIEPPVDGKLEVSKQGFSFKPSNFPTGELIRLTLNPDLQSKDGRTIDPSQREQVFGAFDFRPVRVWPATVGADSVTLSAAFPLPVALEDLKSYSQITDKAGNPVDHTWALSDNPTIGNLQFTTGQAWPVTLRFKAGMPDARGIFTLDTMGTYIYPDDWALKVRSIKWEEFRKEQQQIRIGLSKSVSAEDLEEHLTIVRAADNTAVPFEMATDGEESSHVISIEVNTTEEVQLKITVTAGLKSGEEALHSDFSRNLVHAPIVAQPLGISDWWWNYPRRENLALNVRFTSNVEAQALMEHLEITPEVPGLSAEPQGYNRILLKGEWRSQQEYTLRLSPGLAYGDKIQLAEPVTQTVYTDEIPAYVGFGEEGKFYFPKRTGRDIPLETRNVEKVTLTAYRLFPENLVVALDDMNEDEAEYELTGRWSEELKKTEIELPKRPDVVITTQLAPDTLFPKDKRGVFSLEARADELYERGGKIVLWTNIGLLAHWQNDEIVVFAHDLKTLEPLPLAKVTVHSRKNQVLAQGNTDADGILRLANLNKSLGTPEVIVVEFEDDFTFLELEQRQEDLKDVDQTLPAFDRAGYDAFLYADRELYRPGETAHVRWLVRTAYGPALPDVPLQVEVTNPHGRTISSEPTILSDLGTGGMDIATQTAFPTGKYTVTIKVPGGALDIGRYTFNLEDFVPNRIKADVLVNEDRWLASEKYPVTVDAQQLFGAPASGRKVMADVLLRPGFKWEQWKTYTFRNDAEFSPEPIPLGEAQSDADGKAAFEFTYTPPADFTQPMKAIIIGRVFELGGRAVAAKDEVDIFPSPVALGLALAPRAEGGVDVNVAAVNVDGTPADLATVKVTLERQVWNYYVRRYYSHNEPRWSESFEPFETKDVSLTEGIGSTDFTFEGYGYYRVRVHSEATPQYSTSSFYSYRGRANPVDDARPSLIKLSLDKPQYTFGEEAVVRIESPFDGNGFVLLQGEEFQALRKVKITDGVGLVRFEIGREQFPNAWVEATVVHAVEEGGAQVYPFSSFAAANLLVTDPARQVDITIPNLAEEYRPAQQISIDVETKDHNGAPVATELTLAAVDEGIHSITGYESPKPYEWLSRPRRPDLRRAHYYDKIAYDFEKPAAGGGLEALLGKRSSPVDENWIKPVALWSGAVRTDENGKATVTFDVPEFTGQLRFVAVAATGDSLGVYSGNAFIRRPFMLRTSMPRFLLPGDTTHPNVVLFNHTDADVTARVSWSAEGTLAGGEGSKEVIVPAQGETSFRTAFTAGSSVGQGMIHWQALFVGADGAVLESLTEDAAMPVRAPAAFQSHHELVTIEPGESRTLKNTSFSNDSRLETEVFVGANPLWKLKDELDDLIQYPYGCIEQTTSRLLPLYMLRQADSLVESSLKSAKVKAYVDGGIARLFAMQTSSGGLGNWPGASSPYPYGSVYALHFLTIVHNDREVALPQENFEALQEYVRGIMNDSNDDSQSSLYQRAYATYVLVLAGDTEAINQIQRFDRLVMPESARYLLAAAIAHGTQDFQRAKSYLESMPSEPYTERELGGTLNSPIRSKAVDLAMLLQLGATQQELAPRAEELIAWIKTHVWGSTQEKAFVVTALAGYFNLLTENIDAAAAAIAGPEGDAAITGKQSYHGAANGPDRAFTITNTGPVAVYVNFTTRGVPEKVEYTVVKEGMSIHRTFYTSAGKPYNDKTYSQTDSFVVGVEITCDSRLENVVVADLLPAGFEIENPRLDSDAVPAAEFEKAITPSYVDMRDDRLIAAFDELKEGVSRFYYIVSAVTPGKYQHPAVSAECMYDPSIRASSMPNVIEVSE